MAKKVTPEEQLLRLIENEPADGVKETAEPARTGGEDTRTKPKSTAPSFSAYLASLGRWLKPRTFNLKMVNRILTVVTVTLSLLLIWEISQRQASAEEIIKSWEGNVKVAPIKPIIWQKSIDDVEMETAFKRNIFQPVVKEEVKVPKPVEPLVVTPSGTAPITPPPPPDAIIEDLKKKYRLVGIWERTGQGYAIIEGENATESYVVRLNGPVIRGRVVVNGIPIDYSLKVKEIKEDTVTLMDETLNKSLDLNLVQ